MLPGRLFAYADAHRYWIGVNYKQVPVNKPQCPIHSYSKDGAMRVQNVIQTHRLRPTEPCPIKLNLWRNADIRWTQPF